MKKAKLLIPLVGSFAAISATVPAMVSCAKAQEEATITCSAPKTKTIAVKEKVEFKCTYTGTLDPFIIEGEEVMAAEVEAYTINEKTGIAEKIGAIFYEKKDDEKGTSSFRIDKDGNFTFYMAIDNDPGEYKFQLSFYVMTNHKLELIVVDGFDYTVNA